jgi:HK97 family phage portal protein
VSKSGFAAAFGNAGQNKNSLYSTSGTWSPGGIQLGLSEDLKYLSAADALNAYRGWVYNAVSTISADMAALEITVVTVKRDGSEDEALRHPMLSLIDRPNAQQRGNQLRQLASIHLDTAGEAFFYVPSGVRGPEALHLLQPDRVYIVPHPEQFIQGYLYFAWSGQLLAFLPEEVIHIKYANPTDPYRGYSPVRALGFIPSLNDGLRAYISKYLKNDARPGGVLSSPEAITNEQKKLMVQWWNEVYSGTGGAGRTAVLSNGVKYQPIQDGISALNVSELAQFGRDEVLAAYNMPAAKLGLMADANRANADAADYTYRSNCLAPRACIWEEQLYQPLLELYPASEKQRARVENPVPTDNEALFKTAQSLFKDGAITVRDYLSRLNAPEAADAPEVYVLARGSTIVSQLEEMIGVSQPVEPDTTTIEPDITANTPPIAPKAPESPAKKAKKARLRGLFAQMYVERRDGRTDRTRDVQRLTEITGDPVQAAGVLLTIEQQVRSAGLVQTFETLKSSAVTGPLADLMGDA